MCFYAEDFVSFNCEMVATSFPVQSGSQKELISLLPRILDDNLLYDFDRKYDYCWYSRELHRKMYFAMIDQPINSMQSRAQFYKE